MKVIVVLLGFLLIAGCTAVVDEEQMKEQEHTLEEESRVLEESHMKAEEGEIKEAIFAGGCFWCMEAAFEEEEGVVEAISGYTGGEESAASYKEVSSGSTGHYEAVIIRYDSARVSYARLVDLFWRQIDPTDDGGQFADRGSQYKTAIFYLDEEQKAVAEASKKALEESGKFDMPIVTEILPASEFFEAEEYHQDYYKKRTAHYEAYAAGSGRKGFTEQTWKDEPPLLDEKTTFVKPSDEELKKMLTPLQYAVTQEEHTEAPFDNEFWNEKREGIYVDIVSGEILFSSRDKYDSGTGWPSFHSTLAPENIIEKDDWKLIVKRTEVRSKSADSHLGHLFKESASPTGERYCINSASLRFIPKEEMETQGYGEYLDLFD
jgi:peptide methionine sulfoxide reductase msrA/msrB